MRKEEHKEPPTGIARIPIACTWVPSVFNSTLTV